MRADGDGITKQSGSRIGTVVCDRCKRIIPKDATRPSEDQLVIQNGGVNKLVNFGYFRCPYCEQVYIVWVDDGTTLQHKKKLQDLQQQILKKNGSAKGKRGQAQNNAVFEIQKLLDKEQKLRRQIMMRQNSLKNMYTNAIISYVEEQPQ